MGLPRRKRDRDKGPKDRPILWTPKLADPRSPIRANSPSRSYSLRGNVHPGNELSLSLFLRSSTSSVAFSFFSTRSTELISNEITDDEGDGSHLSTIETKMVNRRGAEFILRNRDPYKVEEEEEEDREPQWVSNRR